MLNTQNRTCHTTIPKTPYVAAHFLFTRKANFPILHTQKRKFLSINHIDGFNAGARRNAGILAEMLKDVPGIQAPDTVEGDHIYVYYPLTLHPAKRDDLRNYLLKNGFDSKTSDMSDSTALKPFKETAASGNDQNSPKEASILQICVYPVIPEAEMRRLGNTIRIWAGLPKS